MAGANPFALRLVLLVCLVWAATACGGHEHDHWMHTVELKGRSRTLLSRVGRKCGTPEPRNMTELELKHSKFMAVRAAKEAAVVSAPGGKRPIKTYPVPVYVWVVLPLDGTGIGNVPDAQINKQIQVLQTAYASKAKEAGIAWNFKVAQIKRVKGPSMCDKEGETAVKAKFHMDKRGVLNLYFTDLTDCGLLGFSTWPWEFSQDPKKDGVTIHYDTLPGGSYTPYNEGRTAVHEIGHWMGLYHTFQNGCTRNGDAVTDTPYSASPTVGCPKARDTCSMPGTDPIHNFMDYSDDACMHAFTPLQHKRMEATWQQYREGGTGRPSSGGAAAQAPDLDVKITSTAGTGR